MAFLVFLTLLVSLLSAAPLIRLAPKHAGYYGYAKLQRFHSGDVPRLGGINVFLGLAVGWGYAALATNWGSTLNVQVNWSTVWPWHTWFWYTPNRLITKPGVQNPHWLA